MSTQSKNKILLVIIGILLITNIGLVSFYSLSKPAQKKSMRPDRTAMISAFLKNELNFNQTQLAQYDSLSNQHRILIRTKLNAIRKEKETEFNQLTQDNFSDSSIVNTAVLFSTKQKEIEIIMFNYFKDIRNLCSPQQQPKFDSMFYKMLTKKNDERKK